MQALSHGAVASVFARRDARVICNRVGLEIPSVEMEGVRSAMVGHDVSWTSAQGCSNLHVGADVCWEMHLGGFGHAQERKSF